MRPVALSTLSGGPGLGAGALSALVHASLIGLLLAGAGGPAAPPASHMSVEVVSVPAGDPGSAPSLAAAPAQEAPVAEAVLTPPAADPLATIEAEAAIKLSALPVEAVLAPDAGGASALEQTMEAARTSAPVVAPEVSATEARPVPAAEEIAAAPLAQVAPPLPPRRPAPPPQQAARAATVGDPGPSTGAEPVGAEATSAAQEDDRSGEATAASVPGGPSRSAALRPGGNPAPTYPTEARRRGQEGQVILRVVISPEGQARAVQVLSSSGHARLDRAAAEAVERWRFEPARRAGRPVEGRLDIPVVFRLENS